MLIEARIVGDGHGGTHLNPSSQEAETTDSSL